MGRRSSLVAVLACAVTLSARGDEDDTFWRPQGDRHAALVAQATAFLDGGNPGVAVPLLEDAVKLEPRDALGFYLLGQARYQLRSWPECADALTTLTRLEPRYLPAARGGGPAETVDDMLGLCLALSGRLDEAVAHYRRMLAGPPGAGNLDALHGNLGDCFQALGRLDEAVEEYQAALAVAPRRVALHAAMAVAYDRDERVERAREAMGRALAIDPQLGELSSPSTFFIPGSDAHYYQGLGHLVAGRRQQAIASFRKYLDVASPQTPWLPRARAHLHELGSPALRAEDFAVLPADAAEGPAIVRELLAIGLGACFEPAARAAVVRASVAFHGHGKQTKPVAPAISTSSAGPDPASAQAMECVQKKLASRKHAVRQMTRIQVAIGPP